jgi:hypothetical protein
MLNLKKSSIITIIASLTLSSVWTPLVWAHNAALSDQPVLACEIKTLKDKCSYTNKSGDLYRGSCQSFNDTLMCVRNLPIIKAVYQDEHTHGESDDHEHTADESTHTHSDVH